MAEKRDYEELEKRIQESEQNGSKLKREEKALQKSEDQYRRVVDDLPGLICRFLPGYKITFVNNAYCEYFDKTLEGLVGSNFLALIKRKSNILISNAKITSHFTNEKDRAFTSKTPKRR